MLLDTCRFADISRHQSSRLTLQPTWIATGSPSDTGSPNDPGSPNDRSLGRLCQTTPYRMASTSAIADGSVPAIADGSVPAIADGSSIVRV